MLGAKHIYSNVGDIAACAYSEVTFIQVGSELQLCAGSSSQLHDLAGDGDTLKSTAGASTTLHAGKLGRTKV